MLFQIIRYVVGPAGVALVFRQIQERMKATPNKKARLISHRGGPATEEPLQCVYRFRGLLAMRFARLLHSVLDGGCRTGFWSIFAIIFGADGWATVSKNLVRTDAWKDLALCSLFRNSEALL